MNIWTSKKTCVIKLEHLEKIPIANVDSEQYLEITSWFRNKLVIHDGPTVESNTPTYSNLRAILPQRLIKQSIIIKQLI